MRRLALASVVAIFTAFSFGIGACASKQVDSESTAPAASAPAKAATTSARAPCACAGEVVVDPALLAFLSKARSAHHQADLAEEEKDTKRALAALAQITSGPLPGGVPPPAEVAEVIADARARLADLESAAGDLDAALREIDAGLAYAVTPTHFRGHLFEVKGIVLERRIAALKEKGDGKVAERVKGEAISAFNEAIEIQNKVIEGALPGAGDGGAPPPR
jgi:tetratricopeptide (TPR) repeat protein